MTDRRQESVDEDLADALADAKKHSSAATPGNQNAHRLALQSILMEFKHNDTDDREDPEPLANKHFRKQDKLAKQAVDEFHSHLAAAID